MSSSNPVMMVLGLVAVGEFGDEYAAVVVRVSVAAVIVQEGTTGLTVPHVIICDCGTRVIGVPGHDQLCKLVGWIAVSRAGDVTITTGTSGFSSLSRTPTFTVMLSSGVASVSSSTLCYV